MADPFSTERILRQQLPTLPAFAPDRPVLIKSAPGRVDVVGGFAAEVGGTVGQMAVPARAAVALQIRTDNQFVLHASPLSSPSSPSIPHTPQVTFPLQSLNALKFDEAESWARPLAGLLALFAQIPSATPVGLSVAVASAIPWYHNQGRSTAITSALAVGLAEIYGLKLEVLDLAILVQRAEHLLERSGTHVIDALTCLSARPGPPQHLLRFSARPHTLAGQIAIPDSLQILTFDTGVETRVGPSTVEGLRLAGAMGLRIVETVYKDLGRSNTPLRNYLTNISPALYKRYFRGLLPRRMRGADFLRTYGPLPERSGSIDPAKVYRVRTAVDHLLAEHEYAENFLQAMEELTDPTSPPSPETPAERELTCRRAGRLLLASHHSYRLRLELSTPEADWLVDALTASEHSGVYGARITGSGGGGTVVALLSRTLAARQTVLDAICAYARKRPPGSLPLRAVEPGSAGAGGVLATPPT